MQIKSFEQYQTWYKESIENPEQFWGKIAENFEWESKWNTVQSGNFDDVNFRWFEGAKLNITVNAIDRHVKRNPHKKAVIFEPNQPSASQEFLTYKQLSDEVNRFANGLRSLGIQKGDVVCLYMGMTPELLIATLACARIGAIHSVVFGGFSATALSERINDAQAKILITHDSVFRGTKEIRLKDISDQAVQTSSSIEKVVVARRTMAQVNFNPSTDVWWHELVKDQSNECAPEIMDAEDPLFILYTSGSTGKPKGLMHTTAGYMVGTTFTFQNVFQTDENSVYWCTADIGWITGHSYLAYAPLISGVTTLMFEGVPTYPDASRFWKVVEKHRVTHFYTAPTAIRALEACGIEHTQNIDLSSLKVLGTVGEPINVEAWDWYNENIGKGKCPIVDTWWQTETGAMMISPLAGITKTKPCFATLPLPGVEAVLVDAEGKEIVGNSVEGNLCMKKPWPSQARTIYGDHDRFVATYFSTYKGMYFTGDGCRRDEEGFYRITGRVDDVINVSGHRIGTAEIENAINEHDAVFESAVVGYPHDIKGQGIYAFVISEENGDEITDKIKKLVEDKIGALARPEKIQVVKNLPKTRSGKIMRRILRKVAANDYQNLGDTSTLLDPKVVDDLISGRL